MTKMNKEMKQAVITQFENAMSYEEIKKGYVERVTEFRGNKAALKFINEAFAKYVDEVKDIHVNSKGETYQKEVKESTEDWVTLVNELIAMDGIILEACGTWLWVSGATKEHKEALKACGFKYAAKKKMWYKAPAGTKHYKGKKTWEMQKIRDAYGSQVIDNAEEIEETA